MKENAVHESAGMITPVRELAYEDFLGCRVLSRSEIRYLDGGEARVLEIIRGAADLGSLSDDLEFSAETWPELYHLSQDRPNCLRAFRLDASMRVLEIGAGCGGVTRYLGETCGLVDALEPVPERARVARERTRGLGNVEVFVGELGDIPPVPSYDLVVIIGVLEYAAGGSGAIAPHREFLQKAAALLAPGGHLVCAIENRLGVKYLAGAPEDHSGRPYHGLEGYRQGGPARTFSRSELEDLFGAAGLKTAFFQAFPDYKLARAVISDRLFTAGDVRSLAWRLPVFPSPDWLVPRPRGADERLLWRSLVEDGAGHRFGNSFVVVGTREGPQTIWDEALLAVFYSPGRRGRFSTMTRVFDGGSEGTAFLRRSLLSGEAEGSAGLLTLIPHDHPYVPGEDLTEVLATCPVEEVPAWLGRWRYLVEERVPSHPHKGRAPLDLIPRNIIVTGDGQVAPVDQEWFMIGIRSGQVMERGVVWAAMDLAKVSMPDRWRASTVGDLAASLGAAAGIKTGGAWLQAAIDREAEVQAMVQGNEPGDPRFEQARARVRGELAGAFAQPLEHGPLGLREHDLRERYESALAALESQYERERSARLAERAALEAHARGLEDALRAVTGTRGYRALEAYRRAVRRVFPAGSLRGDAYRRLRTLISGPARRRRG